MVVKTDLCIVAHRSRQQGEGVFNGDSPLDDVLTKTFQAVLAVRRGQIQQP